MEFPTKAEFSKQLLSVLVLSEGASVGAGLGESCAVGSEVGEAVGFVVEETSDCEEVWDWGEGVGASA